MRIENLSKEIDMTEVHGAGNQGVFISGATAAANGGLIGAVSQNAGVYVMQGQTFSVQNTIADIAGAQWVGTNLLG